MSQKKNKIFISYSSILLLGIHPFEKRCRVKRVNDGQCDTTELWEDGTDKFVTGFRFLISKIFSFQDNLKSKLRHAELL